MSPCTHGGLNECASIALCVCAIANARSRTLHQKRSNRMPSEPWWALLGIAWPELGKKTFVSSASVHDKSNYLSAKPLSAWDYLLATKVAMADCVYSDTLLLEGGSCTTVGKRDPGRRNPIAAICSATSLIREVPRNETGM